MARALEPCSRLHILLSPRRRAKRVSTALLWLLVAWALLHRRWVTKGTVEQSNQHRNELHVRIPAPTLDVNRTCSVAMCTTNKFPTVGSPGGKVGRLSAGIGPDDGTERDWVRKRQHELLGTDTSDRDAEPAHQLVVMVGSSPFRYAVARHWCTVFQKVPVCSPIWEPVRKQGEEGLLQADAQCGATHRRHVCTELCASSELCQAHETYYCVARPDPSKMRTVTVVYVHSGFGVHTSGPWNWHGCGMSSISMYSKRMRETPGYECCSIMHGAHRTADCSQEELPARYTSEQAHDRAEAHYRLTGRFVSALPGALGFKQIDALVISAGPWDLDRMRKVELFDEQRPGDHSRFISFFDDTDRLRAWLEGYKANATGLVRAMKRAVLGGEGTEFSRIAWMTNPLNPPFVTKETTHVKVGKPPYIEYTTVVAKPEDFW